MNNFLSQLGLAGMGAFGGGAAQQQQGNPFQNNVGLAALQQSAARPIESPEERRQQEIKFRNSAGYNRWWAMIARDPLQDCINLFEAIDQ